jgi:alpha-methylacyl-CoA racemase
MRQRFAEAFKAKTRDEWCRVFEGADACFAPVLSFAEAPTYPHNVQRQAFVELDGVIQPAPAPRFSLTPAPQPRAPGA